MIGTKIVFFLVVVAILVLAYSLTACPTVGFIDSGELALACKYLGIAHPTGYPLYTLLGHVAAIFLWGDLIFRVNLLSLLFAAFAAGFLFLLISRLLDIFQIDSRWRLSLSASMALFAALTPVWWEQGTSNEVYSLNLLLICVSVFALVEYLRSSGNRARWLILSVYALGLSITNHLSAIYFIPGFIIVLAIETLKKRIDKKTILCVCLSFIFPLTIYIFLPIRASFSPFLNWGGVSDPFFLYKHISGWQYRIWMFSDADLAAVAGRIAYSGALLREQFGWFGLILAAIGFIRLLPKEKLFVLFAVLIMLMNLLYAANYQIVDIDSYYLPMIIFISLFTASGLKYLLETMAKAKVSRRIVWILWLVILIITLSSNFIGNFFKANRSGSTFARQGAQDMVRSMEGGSLAIVENWDFYSPWLYLRYEENYRPDITIIDKELLRRSWYVDFVRRYYPALYSRSRERIEEFLRQVEPFERNRPFDPMIIDKSYYDMLGAMIKNESAVGAVYTNIAADYKFLRISPAVPAGILFRFRNSSEFLETPRFDFDRSYWENRFVFRETRVAVLLTSYRRAFLAREDYCRQFGKLNEAEYYKTLAADVESAISQIEK